MELKERVEAVIDHMNAPFVSSMTTAEIIKVIKDQQARINDLEETLRFIEFSTHFTCEMFNGEACDANTKQAYEEQLYLIGCHAKQALSEAGE